MQWWPVTCSCGTFDIFTFQWSCAQIESNAFIAFLFEILRWINAVDVLLRVNVNAKTNVDKYNFIVKCYRSEALERSQNIWSLHPFSVQNEVSCSWHLNPTPSLHQCQKLSIFVLYFCSNPSHHMGYGHLWSMRNNSALISCVVLLAATSNSCKAREKEWQCILPLHDRFPGFLFSAKFVTRLCLYNTNSDVEWIFPKNRRIACSCFPDSQISSTFLMCRVIKW